jgi:hypothetical protein
MLSARDLTPRRGPEPLFERVNFTIFRGDIDRPAALKIAHVEQEIAAIERAAMRNCAPCSRRSRTPRSCTV